MVNKQRFPSAVFGRKMTETRIGSYALLGHSSDFPSDLLDAFESLHGFVRWINSGQSVRYPDCFGTLPLSNNRIIVARFLDVGEDSLDRPHTMRIEGILVEGDLIEELKALNWQLFQSSRWHVSNEGKEPSVELDWEERRTNQRTPEASQFLRVLSKPTFVSTHAFYENLGFEQVYDTTGDTLRMMDVSIPSRRPDLQHNKRYSSVVEVAHVRHSGKLQWIMCFGFLVANGVALFYLNYQFQEQNRRTQMSLESIQNRQIDTEESIADLQSEADTITDKVKETASQVSNLLSTSQKPNGVMRQVLKGSLVKLLEDSNDSFSPEVGLVIFLNFFEERRDSDAKKIRSWLKAYGAEKEEGLQGLFSGRKSSEGLLRSKLVKDLEKWLKASGSVEDTSHGLQKLDQLVFNRE